MLKRLLHLWFLFRLCWSSNFKPTDCHRIFPSLGGTWLDTPPYWLPNCTSHQIHVFGRASVEKCLKGRTVYVVGNSIARGALFGILEMLGGVSVSREDQKTQCPKVQIVWDDSCREEFAGVKLKFLYFKWMDGWDYSDRGGFPFIHKGVTLFTPHPKNIHEVINKTPRDHEENCMNQKTRACLQNYFINATSNDILILTVGLAYAEHAYPEIDYVAFATAQAIPFRKYIEDLFPGKVFRFTGAGYYKKNWTALHREIDTEALWPILRPRNESEEKSWYTIDQWEINKDRRHFYSDSIHYPGPLTSALLYQILSLLCPGMGITADQYKSLYGKLIKLKTDSSAPLQHGLLPTVHYVVDEHLLLHAVPESCLSYVVEQIVDLTPNLELFRKGEDFPVEICQVGLAFQSDSNNQIYRMLQSHRAAKVIGKNLKTNFTKVPDWVLPVLSFQRLKSHIIEGQ